jgi:hypothetical protein
MRVIETTGMKALGEERVGPEKDEVSILELVGAGAVLLAVACLFIL